MTVLRPLEDLDEQSEDSRDNASFPASVISMEEPLMFLLASRETPVYSALRIETGDALWLGETEKCELEAGTWKIRVRLRHVLRDFDTLTRLAERFGTAPPRKISVQA